MRKALLLLGYILFFLTLLLPLGVILFGILGYTFELANYDAFSVVTAALAIACLIMSLIYGEALENRTAGIIFGLLAPVSCVNFIFYTFKGVGLIVTICMFVCIVVCFCLTLNHGRPVALKVIAALLCALMFFPVLYSGFFSLLFKDFGHDTVIYSVSSPDESRYAQIIDSDQGALGGATLVNVYEKIAYDAFIFEIEKTPQTVYYGDWGEFEKMKIYWKGNDSLVVNSKEYKIK